MHQSYFGHVCTKRRTGDYTSIVTLRAICPAQATSHVAVLFRIVSCYMLSYARTTNTGLPNLEDEIEKQATLLAFRLSHWQCKTGRSDAEGYPGAQPYGTEKRGRFGFPSGAPLPLTVFSSACARVELWTN